MIDLFFHIVKRNCKEISSSFDENNFLLITIPKNCSDNEINEYLNSLDDAVFDVQKKAKNRFRARVEELICTYSKEFDIPFTIDLKLLSKSKYICKADAEINGICFSGRINILAVLQFCSEDIVKKIVRYAVYMVAIRYEELCRNITGFSVCNYDMLSGKDTKFCTYNVSEPKYSITLEPSKLNQIQNDCNEAFKQFGEEMKKQQLRYLSR